MMSRSLSFLLAATVVVATTGCAGLSLQKYGSHSRGYSVTPGARSVDVFSNLGEADSSYRRGTAEVLVYKNYDGANYFGLFSTIKRTDYVVIVENGTVSSTTQVDMGNGFTLFSPAFVEATYPVRTTELTESAENFAHESTEEVK